MRRTRPASTLPPVALLALSVLLCGGSVANATTAAVLIQQSHERAGQLRDPESVASLLSCLGEAGKDAQKRFDTHAAAAILAAHRWAPVAAVGRLEPPGDSAVPHLPLLTPTLIDLPPPVARL